MALGLACTTSNALPLCLAVHLPPITTTFQSVFGPEEWLKPYTVDEVARLASEDGKKHVAVIAPAFSADCIETLEEINEEIKESFEEAGGEDFTYIPCLNADDTHMDALAGVVERELRGWLDLA